MANLAKHLAPSLLNSMGSEKYLEWNNNLSGYSATLGTIIGDTIVELKIIDNNNILIFDKYILVGSADSGKTVFVPEDLSYISVDNILVDNINISSPDNQHLYEKFSIENLDSRKIACTKTGSAIQLINLNSSTGTLYSNRGFKSVYFRYSDSDSLQKTEGNIYSYYNNDYYDTDDFVSTKQYIIGHASSSSQYAPGFIYNDKKYKFNNNTHKISNNDAYLTIDLENEIIYFNENGTKKDVGFSETTEAGGNYIKITGASTINIDTSYKISNKSAIKIRDCVYYLEVANLYIGKKNDRYIQWSEDSHRGSFSLNYIDEVSQKYDMLSWTDDLTIAIYDDGEARGIDYIKNQSYYFVRQYSSVACDIFDEDTSYSYRGSNLATSNFSPVSYTNHNMTSSGGVGGGIYNFSFIVDGVEPINSYKYNFNYQNNIRYVPINISTKYPVDTNNNYNIFSDLIEATDIAGKANFNVGDSFSWSLGYKEEELNPTLTYNIYYFNDTKNTTRDYWYYWYKDFNKYIDYGSDTLRHHLLFVSNGELKVYDLINKTFLSFVRGKSFSNEVKILEDDSRNTSLQGFKFYSYNNGNITENANGQYYFSYEIGDDEETTTYYAKFKCNNIFELKQFSFLRNPNHDTSAAAPEVGILQYNDIYYDTEISTTEPDNSAWTEINEYYNVLDLSSDAQVHSATVKTTIIPQTKYNWKYNDDSWSPSGVTGSSLDCELVIQSYNGSTTADGACFPIRKYKYQLFKWNDDDFSAVLYDTDWIYSQDTKFSFDRLIPGDYCLKYIGIDSEGRELVSTSPKFTMTYTIDESRKDDFVIEKDSLNNAIKISINELGSGKLRRRKNNSVVLENVCYNFNGNIMDYSLCGGSQYQYYYFVESANSTTCYVSDLFIPEWQGWTLMDCTPMYEVDDSYTKRDKVYRLNNIYYFNLNVQSGSISNNSKNTIIENFTPYPKIQYTAPNYWSGNLTSLLGYMDVEYGDNYYQNSELLSDIKKISYNTNKKFLKDMDGNIFEVGINGPIEVNNTDNLEIQLKTKSIPWCETGDAAGVSIVLDPALQTHWVLTEDGKARDFITYQWDDQEEWVATDIWTDRRV